MNVETIVFSEAAYPAMTYARLPFPVAVLDGKPWWSTSHVQHFLNGRFDPAKCDVFTPTHCGAHSFPFDGDELSHVISTLAALELAGRNAEWRASKMLSGWLRKRDAELRTAAPEPAGSLYAIRPEGPFPERTFYMGPVLNEWAHWDEEFRKRFSKSSAAPSGFRRFVLSSPSDTKMSPGKPPAPPTDPEELRAWNLSLIGRR